MADAQQAAEAAARVGAEKRAQFLVDDDGVCVEASLGASQLSGRSRQELIGVRLSELFELASAEIVDRAWPDARDRGGEVGSLALRPPAASGEVVVRVTSSVVPGRHLVRLEPERSGAASSQVPQTEQQLRRPSAREGQVLTMLTRGASDREIARELRISPATVQTHVRNAKAKLGARTRAQAVAIAIQRGLIANEPSRDEPGSG